MPEYNIHNNEVLFVTLFFGIALLLFIIAFYVDMWQSREFKKDNGEEVPKLGYLSWLRALPWTLIITFIGSAIYAVSYLIYLIFNPPNW